MRNISGIALISRSLYQELSNFKIMVTASAFMQIFCINGFLSDRRSVLKINRHAQDVEYILMFNSGVF